MALILQRKYATYGPNIRKHATPGPNIRKHATPGPNVTVKTCDKLP